MGAGAGCKGPGVGCAQPLRSVATPPLLLKSSSFLGKPKLPPGSSNKRSGPVPSRVLVHKTAKPVHHETDRQDTTLRGRKWVTVQGQGGSKPLARPTTRRETSLTTGPLTPQPEDPRVHRGKELTFGGTGC